MKGYETIIRFNCFSLRNARRYMSGCHFEKVSLMCLCFNFARIRVNKTLALYQIWSRCENTEMANHERSAILSITLNMHTNLQISHDTTLIWYAVIQANVNQELICTGPLHFVVCQSTSCWSLVGCWCSQIHYMSPSIANKPLAWSCFVFCVELIVFDQFTFVLLAVLQPE